MKLDPGQFKQSDWNGTIESDCKTWFQGKPTVSLGSSPPSSTLNVYRTSNMGKYAQSLSTAGRRGSADTEYKNGRPVFTAAAVGNRTRVPNKPT